MKKLNTLAIIIIIVALAAGYFLGSYFPLSGLLGGSSDKDEVSLDTEIPKNKGRLVVSVVNADNEPMIGIEIDVAVQPGPPEDWGVKEADKEGVAVYDLDPGSYYVFFNLNRFPNEYVIQGEKQISITAGEQEEVTFVLEKK